MQECNKIIAIGASTGGIETLKELVGDLPRDLPAALLVVVHTSPESPNVLDHILARAGKLPASLAQNGERPQPGHIYVSRADHHLLIDADGLLRLSRGPKENRFRPAIDPLFRSAAAYYGPRVIGVVLTGWLDDGTAGLWAIKEHGGIAVVQHPEDAIAPSMPLNALKHVEVNHVVPLAKMPALLASLAHGPAPEGRSKPMSKKMETEVKIAREDNALDSGITTWGDPSLFACPECHGVLLQLKEGSQLRFRCHTGHAYSLESLLSDLTERSEETLWSAVRALDETALLLDQMSRQLETHQHNDAAATLRRKADETIARGKKVREVLLQNGSLPERPR